MILDEATRSIELGYRPRDKFIPYHMRKQRWACIVAHRRAGKTVACIADLIDAALRLDKPNPRFAYIAPLFRQAKQIAWDYVKQYSRKIPGTKVNEAELRVDFPNGGRVQLFGADMPDSARGLYFDGVVVDEPAQMKPEMWSEVLRPALSDRKGWATFIGTPKGQNWFFRIWSEAIRDESWLVLTLKASETGYVDEEELDDARRTMSPNEFEQEFECSFMTPSEDQFIPVEMVIRARERQAGMDSPVVFGVDVARFGSDSSVILVRKGDSIAMVQRYNNMDTYQLANRVAEYINKLRPDAVFVDGVGVGAGVVDQLKAMGFSGMVNEVQGASSSMSKEYSNKVAECWGKMRDWIRERAALPHNDILSSDLTGRLYRYDSSGRIALEKKENMKKRGLSSPDTADALALTFARPVASREAREAMGHGGFGMQRRAKLGWNKVKRRIKR
jgi:hypothetical protein